MDAIRDRIHEVLRRAGISRVARPVVAAVAVLAVIAVAAALWHWWPRDAGSSGFSVSASGSRVDQGRVSAQALADASVAHGGEATGTPGAAGIVYVHIVGAVRRPGLCEVPAGSRVADAIARAGGLLGNAADRAINLARRVEDGEQIVVPTKDEYAAGSSGTGATGSSGALGASPSASAPVNINTADVALLDMLPGIGPSTAQKIVADREANGPFATVDDLARVAGIGAKKLDSLREFIVAR